METEIWPNVTRLSRARAACGCCWRTDGFPTARSRAIASFAAARRRRCCASTTASWRARRRTASASSPSARRAEIVETSGNVKFDYVPDDRPLEIAPQLELADRRPQGARPRLDDGGRGRGADAASWSASSRETTRSSIIAPRKPERFEVVAAIADGGEVRFVRRSEWSDGASGRPAARHVRRAGEDLSLRHRGVHRRQRSCRPAGTIRSSRRRSGVPVCFGPYMSNFREIARRLSARRRRGRSADRAAERVRVRGADVRRRRRAARHGRARAARRCEQNRGAAARTAARIVELLA